jgi:hypothetical protein
MSLRRSVASLAVVAVAVAVGSCSRDGPAPPGSTTPARAAGREEREEMALTLTSTTFEHMGEIPKKHTCEGADVSPPLAWGDVPAGARSLALIVDDPDAPDPAAPRMTYVHWVVYNIPVSAEGLPEDTKTAGLPAGALEGTNDWRRIGYGGPCPPIGRHRYFHKLFALDIVLEGLQDPTKAELEVAMQGHVVGRAELVGTYQKARQSSSSSGGGSGG